MRMSHLKKKMSVCTPHNFHNDVTVCRNCFVHADKLTYKWSVGLWSDVSVYCVALSHLGLH
jgi:hypothetical protein